MATPGHMSELPDREFVEALRAAVQSYLEAVDRWEDAYRQYYRMPGSAPILSSDMEAVQHDYEAQRRALEPLLPRAHRLCLRHRLQNPLPRPCAHFAGRLRSPAAERFGHRAQRTKCGNGMSPAVGRRIERVDA